MSAHRTLLGWPGWSNLWRTGLVSAGVGVWFMVFYGGASAVTALYSVRMRVDADWEQSIPFWPWMSVVYLTMNALVMLSLFVFRNVRALMPFAVSIMAETLIGAVCFVLLPIERAFPTRVVEGFWAPFFHTADTINLEYNDLPSLHVAFACTAALAYTRQASRLEGVWRGWWWVFWGWAGAIAASTAFIHEHHVIDAVAGWLLAMGVMRWVYPRVEIAMQQGQMREGRRDAAA